MKLPARSDIEPTVYVGTEAALGRNHLTGQVVMAGNQYDDLRLRLEALERLRDAVKCYADADAMVRGEAYRDMCQLLDGNTRQPCRDPLSVECSCFIPMMHDCEDDKTCYRCGKQVHSELPHA